MKLAIICVTFLSACGGQPTPGSGGESSRNAPALAFVAEPTIRVGIAWGDSVARVGGPGRWWIHESSTTRPIAVVEQGAGWSIVRLPFERALRARRSDGYLSQAHVEPLVVAPLGSTPVEANGVAYPGSIEVSIGLEGALTVVNVVPMETYLEGVVPKELGRPGPEAQEALRAQAVAARTYALKRLGSRAELGFDVYGTIMDQAYIGLPETADSLAVRAVRATRGEALLFNGHLIDAYYHSTCGGQTARVDQVFDDPPTDYLTVVSDAREDGQRFWCQDSRYFRWNVRYAVDELQQMMSRNLADLVPLPPDGVGILRDVEVLETTPEGRALVVRVTTTTGRYMVTENAIRELFADAEGHWLRSTLFLFRPVRERGRLVELTLTGGGWGHGVGMCQVGAMGRARAGQSYQEILATYYQGTTLEAVY